MTGSGSSARRGSSTGGGTAGTASTTGPDAVSTSGPDAVSTSGPDDSDVWPAPAPLAEARAHLARVDRLPVAERAQLLAAVNELLVAELAAMDEGWESGLGAGADLGAASLGLPKAATGLPETAGGTG